MSGSLFCQTFNEKAFNFTLDLKEAFLSADTVKIKSCYSDEVILYGQTKTNSEVVRILLTDERY